MKDDVRCGPDWLYMNEIIARNFKFRAIDEQNNADSCRLFIFKAIPYPDTKSIPEKDFLFCKNKPSLQV